MVAMKEIILNKKRWIDHFCDGFKAGIDQTKSKH